MGFNFLTKVKADTNADNNANAKSKYIMESLTITEELKSNLAELKLYNF